MLASIKNHKSSYNLITSTKRISSSLISKQCQRNISMQSKIVKEGGRARESSLSMIDFFAQTKPKPSYRLTHGASGFSKKRQSSFMPRIHSLSSTSIVSQIGEDAYFRREDAMGVADGIGGWSDTKGSDSALYSTQLMHYANLEMERFENIDDPLFFKYNDANPLDILKRSYERMISNNSDVLGATTACIAVLRQDDLRVAHLGDCGIFIIRNNHYIFRTEEQQHAFNFPYQLGVKSRDKPQHAQLFNIKVEKGDIIIMATDGLYDNLFDLEILELVRDYVCTFTIPARLHRPAKTLLQPQLLADILANAAKEVSEGHGMKSIDTPFQRRAMEEGLVTGCGKQDDISVVVAIVNDCEDSPDRRL